jgi:hypothetical protein
MSRRKVINGKSKIAAKGQGIGLQHADENLSKVSAGSGIVECL